MKENFILLGKGTLGVSSSLLATIFSNGWDETFKEVAVLGGILVSFLTVLNLMWGLMDKIHATITSKRIGNVTVNTVVEAPKQNE